MSASGGVPMVNLAPMLLATRAAWAANLARLFEGGQFILGEQVAEFEREFAAASGAKYAVAVGSGTAAIDLCLRAAGLGGSSAEVLTSTLTSPFTAQAILAAGCRPRFADVGEEHLLLDPARMSKRTRAIMPVHLYGQPYDCGRLPSGAVVIQDACQAHGAAQFTRDSPFVAFSFYPTKNLPCLGDGGAVTTDSKRVADAVRLLRDGGRRADQVSRLRAVHSRLDEMQACYLRAFLPKLALWNDERVRTAAIYDSLLAGCDGIRPIARRPGSVCHLYVIRAKRRERLRTFLRERGISTGIHFPIPLHLQPAFREFGPERGRLPIAERACREIVSLPLWPGMTEAMVNEVAGRVREFYR
ncbi:MAG: DegT/DnrJ/EryC1/StrS family aminotransferase [Bryobacteraceae bacterium]|jgi:dTDP-4-amino-4,6-dideoxygalactose transaminase